MTRIVSSQTGSSGHDWLTQFIRDNARAPRVLHIGNIANNAYLNARVLNESGFDCDVLCHDYYHIMGCPEWEDVDFDARLLDEFSPDWSRLDLGGYKRPPWFAQGPRLLCTSYLEAKRSDRKLKAAVLKRILDLTNRTVRPSLFEQWLLEKTSLESAFLQRLHEMIFNRVRAREYFQKKFERLLKFFPSELKFFLATILRKCTVLGVLTARWTLIRLFDVHPPAPAPSLQDSEITCSALNAILTERFPDRDDRFDIAEAQSLLNASHDLKRLFVHYDFVVGYATDPIWPLLAGQRPFLGFEHGTIRDIPFEPSYWGRICAVGYASADAIIMTNADSIPQAQLLASDPRKIVYGLHGFDERNVARRLSASSKSRFDLRFGVPDGRKLFLAPARQHWKNGFATWLKGNNLIVEGIHELKKTHAGHFTVAFVKWGREIHLTEELIKSLDVNDHVMWINPIQKADLAAVYANVDGVIDQFVLPCIGGVPIEAMTVGQSPVITKLDDRAMEEFFGETIPLLNCATPLEIAAAMKLVIEDSARARSIARECKTWMDKHHTHQNVVDVHARAYEIASRSNSSLGR